MKELTESILLIIRTHTEFTYRDGKPIESQSGSWKFKQSWFTKSNGKIKGDQKIRGYSRAFEELFVRITGMVLYLEIQKF